MSGASAGGGAAVSQLFLSCDLVGSTLHKQARPAAWPKTFLSFYREFPQVLGSEARAIQPALEFRLWKAIGDELVFTCTVRHEIDVAVAVRVWLAAMQRYEESSLVGEELGTKGGAFIATFPGPDSRVAVPLDPASEISDKGVVELNDDALAAMDPTRYMYDFLGPSVDTGFRLVDESDPRHFTLSIEAAWAYCRGARQHDGIDADDLAYLGERELKGVWSGRPYPIVAIDRGYLDPVNQAMAALAGTAVTLDGVEQLCSRCATTPGWPSSIYLPDSAFAPFRRAPEDSLASLRTNAMDGAETLPTESRRASELLRANAPLS